MAPTASPTTRASTRSVATSPQELHPQVKAERYDVKKGKWVKASYPDIFTVAGEYRFTLTGTADDAKNYKFANADNTTVVTTLCVDEKDLVFRDVLPGEWYFDAVADAKGLGYVAGVSGSKYYQPTAAIKRCDVIVILARMAGVDTTLNGMTEDEFSKGYGIYLDYNDVDESLPTTPAPLPGPPRSTSRTAPTAPSARTTPSPARSSPPCCPTTRC